VEASLKWNEPSLSSAYCSGKPTQNATKKEAYNDSISFENIWNI
jgi:hypothetical protein